MRRILGLAAVVVFAVGVAAVAGNARQAAEEAHRATELAERADQGSRQRLYRSQIAACERGVADRQVHRAQAWASYRANMIVARDPRQPDRTRRARAAQANANRAAVRSFDRRLPPRLVCDRDVAAP